MLIHRRLLVTHAGSAVDPRLIRYAAMLTRLNAPVGQKRREPRATRKGRPLQRSTPLATAQAQLTDLETRFLAVVSNYADSDPLKLARHARLVLHAQVDQHFRAASTPTNVGCDAIVGGATGRVLSYARDFGCDLLVVGRSEWPLNRLAHFAMASPSATWFVPADSAPVLRRIVVPIDFSLHSIASLRTAIRLAQRFAPAKCLLVHVDRQILRGAGDEISPRRREELLAAVDGLLQNVDTHGITVSSVLVKGQRIERCVARVAEDHSADLVVMATRGRTRFAGRLLPSIAAAVVREFSGAVLSLKSSPRPFGWNDALREHLKNADGPNFS